jgi:dienelactone hydrolase
MDEARYSPLKALEALYQTEQPWLRCDVRTPEEWRLWRTRLMYELRRLLGPMPDAETDLNPRVLGEETFGDHTRIRVDIAATPDLDIPCYLLIPRGCEGARPALVCCQGHGMDKEILCGVALTKERREVMERLNGAYALEAVRHGYVAIAYDVIGFGQRRDPVADPCLHVMLNAMMIGRTITAMRIWDIVRLVDYLQTRPEVDGERLGIIGLSMGAELTMYGMILDERLNAGVSSCVIRDLKPEITGRRHCACSYVPGLLQYADWSDLACLIPPKPLLLEVGSADDNTPRDAAVAAYEKLRRVYELLGMGERTELDEFGGGHAWRGDRAWPFLAKWL